MKTFPMFLKMTDRRIVIVGGGEQAAQKCRLALKTEAQIVIVHSGEIDAELADIIDEGRAERIAGEITPEIFAGSALVFVATGDEETDAHIHGVAKSVGATVNVVDQPDLCDAFTPSIVDRDPVVVAIGTEGTAPVLARQIKTRMEEILEPNLGGLAALAGRLRNSAEQNLGPIKRRDLWRWVFSASPRADFTSGRERPAALAIKEAIANGGAPTEDLPGVCVVSTGADSRDMMTLRAVKRMQEADAIYFAPLKDMTVLELARRDAERVETTESNDVFQQLLDAAQAGKRVVWLTNADTEASTFCKELAAECSAANIRFETVAGVFPRG
ncbi:MULTISPECIES: siroheme synthase [Halocynthiibacter]|uniref:precorrin-2 dehydrogenase n=1 Tax=Halocynthiibacter halioticoli TaxID=2986804 RepID=A0AAE3IWT9_9RHOB|nr:MULTISPECIES: siroheme synthase [Halocynthiibacter]MCV6823548.1 siroheme synthase [Halocynthiibacter halioticoli]MCW4056549.1 siroheme synthase [Halocynthiibacter sp. SDUM655004]